MVKFILIFLLVFCVFFFGIRAFRELSGKAKWALTKYLAYSTLCTILTLGFLVTIVILF